MLPLGSKAVLWTAFLQNSTGVAVCWNLAVTYILLWSACGLKVFAKPSHPPCLEDMISLVSDCKSQCQKGDTGGEHVTACSFHQAFVPAFGWAIWWAYTNARSIINANKKLPKKHSSELIASSHNCRHAVAALGCFHWCLCFFWTW